MRYSEKDRRELINKLKKVRDPRERDRIIWVLAGQEEGALHGAAPQVSPLWHAPVRTQLERPAPVKTPERKDIPPMAFNAQRMLGFVVPVFFMIFGLVRIGQALLNYMESRQIEPEISSLITGGIFLIIGLAGIFRSMQPGRIKQDEVS
jgi:hypothetical protein